jgi:quinol monooxygenase YgiN
MPGELALGMILWEYQVHGWDLATALDRAWVPDPAGVEASLAFAPMMLTDEYQGEGKTFGPRVPVAADAPALDRLLGLSGRDPRLVLPRFGYLSWMRCHPGRRDELVAVLTGDEPEFLRSVGCRRYIVMLDLEDDDLVRVSEVWRTKAHHDASLELPESAEAIARAMPLLTGDMGGHATTVVGGLC